MNVEKNEEEVLNEVNAETPEPIWDIEIKGNIDYSISISMDGHYKHQASTTEDGELIMILDCVNALNRMKSHWPKLEEIAKYHEHKKVREQAKLSCPTAQNKMAIAKAIHELEKIRDGIMREIVKKHIESKKEI